MTDKPRKITKYSTPAENVTAELLAYGESPTADEYVKHTRYGYHGEPLADDEPPFLGDEWQSEALDPDSELPG